MGAEAQVLLQLAAVDLSANHLSGTLPPSWGGLTQASCALEHGLSSPHPI